MLTDFDHQMIHHAKARGAVVVIVGDHARVATLVAWRPQRNGKHTRKARVRFLRGTFASVPLDTVTIPERTACTSTK